MNTELQQTSYKFDFFNKPVKPNNKVAWFTLSLTVALFIIGGVLLNMNTVSNFHKEINRYQVYKNDIETKSIPLLKELNISLQKNNWEVAQAQLIKLNELSSTKVNKDTIQALTDYAIKNFTSKKQSYSSEFSLLLINYLNGMYTNPRKELWTEYSLQNNLDISWSSDKPSMENLMNKEINIANENKIKIQEKALFLTKGLKEPELKIKFVKIFSEMTSKNDFF